MKSIALTVLLSILLLGAAPTTSPTTDPVEQELFNGKDLTGWDGDMAFWSVKDSCITGQTTKDHQVKQNSFLIWKGGNVGDFEIHFKFKLIGGNSGLQYRSKDLGNFVVSGYQADMDADNKFTGILYEEKGRAIMCGRGEKLIIDEVGKKQSAGKTDSSAKEILEAIKKEDWNEYIVSARGNHLVQTINGKVTVDVTDNDAKKRASTGILAFQLHAGFVMTVQFKEVKLKVFPAPATQAKE